MLTVRRVTIGTSAETIWPLLALAAMAEGT